MSEVQTFPYKVIGANTVIAHNFEDYTEGDTIELPKHVAVNFKSQLEPLSEEGKFDVQEPDVLRQTATYRDHEKEQILRDRKSQLETELDKIDAELTRIDGAKKKAAPAPAAEKPAATAKKT